MGNIVLIRHAKSIANELRYLGNKDVRLSSRGEKEAIAIRDEAKRIKRDRIYVSEYKRAIETANILFEGENLTISDRVNEVDFGEFLGYTHDDLKANFPEEYNLWTRDPFNFAPPKGETLSDYFQKVAGFMEDLRREDSNIVIVTHDGFIRSFLSMLFLSTEAYYMTSIKNCKFQCIENPEGYFILSGLNLGKLPNNFIKGELL